MARFIFQNAIASYQQVFGDQSCGYDSEEDYSSEDESYHKYSDINMDGIPIDLHEDMILFISHHNGDWTHMVPLFTSVHGREITVFKGTPMLMTHMKTNTHVKNCFTVVSMIQ